LSVVDMIHRSSTLRGDGMEVADEAREDDG
jgi:hypothetical protein